MPLGSRMTRWSLLRRPWPAACCTLGLAACAPPPTNAPALPQAIVPLDASSPSARPPTSSAAAASAAPQAPSAPPPSTGPSAPRFIEDDYARALAQARARGLPLFVDAWAPWCHTCLSMRAFVFPDERLRTVASRFVWLSLDAERLQNGAVISKLGVRVLPTLYVVDPRDERVLLAWPGSLTAPELVTLLDDARSGAGPRGPMAVDAEVARSSSEGRLAVCAATAAAEAPHMPPGTALADVIRSGIECAEKQIDDPQERERLAALAALGERVASDPSQPILADDRSDLYDYTLEAYRDLDRRDAVQRLAGSWTAFLEDQAARAPSPAARAVFDAHRVLAYLALGKPERVIPFLQRSERDFPDDFDPPARLAAAYLSMKRFHDALAACERALARAYGPRKLRLWSLQADVRVAMGDVSGARDSLRAALEFAHRADLGARYDRQIASITRRLAELR